MYRVPDMLAHVVVGGGRGELLRVYLMRLPDGPPFAISGTAALIWLKAVEGGRDVAAEVAVEAKVPRTEIADDVNDYLGRLIDEGLLSKED